jgi:hypothetical protein
MAVKFYDDLNVDIKAILHTQIRNLWTPAPHRWKAIA